MKKDLMWFFDELPEDYRAFREMARSVEHDYLKLRVHLKAAVSELQADPANPELQAKVQKLTEELATLEEQAPCLVSDQLIEFALWAVPHKGKAWPRLIPPSRPAASAPGVSPFCLQPRQAAS